jgi:L-fuculose-phosphate aldolase
MAAYMKMESVEFYAELLYKSKMLGGPKEFDKDQVQRLYEIRRQMGLPGRHPANLCQNKGKANCHNCGSCNSSEGSGDSQELVAAITKKVLEQLGK